MRRYQAGTWTTVTLPSNCSSAGTFDPSTGTLYVRIVSSNGFMVINSATATFTNTVTVSGFHNFELTDGAFYGGNWYTQDDTNPIQRVNATTGGAPTSTGATPASIYSAMTTDFRNGFIYLAGWGDNFGAAGRALVRFDPVANTVTNLASAPTGVNSESNLVWVSH
jgi:hypothetical protein